MTAHGLGPLVGLGSVTQALSSNIYMIPSPHCVVVIHEHGYGPGPIACPFPSNVNFISAPRSVPFRFYYLLEMEKRGPIMRLWMGGHYAANQDAPRTISCPPYPLAGLFQLQCLPLSCDDFPQRHLNATCTDSGPKDSTTMSFKSEALVARGPLSQGKWSLEPVTLRDLQPDEVLVEMVASGICHTDLHCGDTADDLGVPAVYYPRVLGHEGSGYVVQVGSAVTKVRPGDPVLLSFSYCGTCYVCKTGPRSHCVNFFDINFMGEPVFEGGIGGRFFGQSSLARHSVVSDKSVVNVAGLGLSRDDLRVLAPLGCGFQTGSGTVVKVANVGEDDCVAIAGMGGVGLAAVMAAKERKCKAIIGIDRVGSRLDLAKSLGATHVINTTGLDMAHVTAKIKEAAEGIGATISIDTSAYPPLVAAQVDATRYMGKCIQVGTGMPDANLSIHMQSFMVSGKHYFGAVQGHSKTEEYIPQMIQWWKDGTFPIERLVEVFQYSDFARAVEAMKRGEVVKPIIAWS